MREPLWEKPAAAFVLEMISMPKKPKRPCSYPGRPNLTDGRYCPEHPDKVKALALIAAQYKMPEKLLKIQNMLFRLMPNSTFDIIYQPMRYDG